MTLLLEELGDVDDGVVDPNILDAYRRDRAAPGLLADLHIGIALNLSFRA